MLLGNTPAEENNATMTQESPPSRETTFSEPKGFLLSKLCILQIDVFV
jgi:hypothetical protein